MIERFHVTFQALRSCMIRIFRQPS